MIDTILLISNMLLNLCRTINIEVLSYFFFLKYGRALVLVLVLFWKVSGSSDIATENDLSELIPVTVALKLNPEDPIPVVLLLLMILTSSTLDPVSRS